jgi:hypothetical protein
MRRDGGPLTKGRCPYCDQLMHRARQFTEDHVVAWLAKVCKQAGGQKEWAHRNGVSPQYVCDVLQRRRKPGTAICDALKLGRVELYEDLCDPECAP